VNEAGAHALAGKRDAVRAKVDGQTVTPRFDSKGIVGMVRQRGAEFKMRAVASHTGRLAALMPIKQAANLSKFLASPVRRLLALVSEGQWDEGLNFVLAFGDFGCTA
jgi:hypothetical protein